jgi:hypothetical protein
MAAACSHAETLRQADAAQGRAAYELAGAFCEQARLRVERLFDDLWANTDDTDRRIAARVLDGAYSWLENGIVDPSDGTGPWIAEWTAGPSRADNVHRDYR